MAAEIHQITKMTTSTVIMYGTLSHATKHPIPQHRIYVFLTVDWKCTGEIHHFSSLFILQYKLVWKGAKFSMCTHLVDEVDSGRHRRPQIPLTLNPVTLNKYTQTLKPIRVHQGIQFRQYCSEMKALFWAWPGQLFIALCQWLPHMDNRSICKTVVVKVKLLSANQYGFEMSLIIMCYICYNIWDTEHRWHWMPCLRCEFLSSGQKKQNKKNKQQQKVP